jgi:hypothetical protein
MSTITRVRNSTKRLAFKWNVTNNGYVNNNQMSPLNLTGMTLEMIIDTEKIESTPNTPIHVASILGVITDAINGQAYFPLSASITNTIRNLFFEIWVVDSNNETYPIDSGVLNITGGLK